jgi:hypothetical protein
VRVDKEWGKICRLNNEYVKKISTKQGDFVVIPNYILAALELNAHERLLYGVLLFFVRSKGRYRCYPSIEAIASFLGMSISHAQRCVRSLRDKFWIEWKRTGRSNEYRLISPAEHDAKVRMKVQMERHKREKNSASG